MNHDEDDIVKIVTIGTVVALGVGILTLLLMRWITS